jgi:hypothetical protein
MEGAAIKQNDLKGACEAFGNLVEKDLKTCGIQMREGEKEMVACLRVDDPIEIKRHGLLVKWGEDLDG